MGTTAGYLLYVFSALFLYSGISQATRVVHGVAQLAQHRDAADNVAIVSHSALLWLEWADGESRSSTPARDWRPKLRGALEYLADREGIADNVERVRRTDYRMQLFDERGSTGFTRAPS